jgi:hypothetical protein
MDREVHRMKWERIERRQVGQCREHPANLIVGGKREIGDRPMRQFAPLEHRPPRWQERADRGVVYDLGEVVEEERAAKARGIGGDHRQRRRGEDHKRPPDDP